MNFSRKLISTNIIKTDLGREVTKDEANQFKRKNNLALFLECSSKEGNGVDEIFTEVINTVLNDNNLEKQTMTSAKKEEITIQQEKQPNPDASLCQEC
jgi:Rab family protein